MNKQAGFVGIIVVIISLAILGAVSYKAYNSNTFGIKDHLQPELNKKSVEQNSFTPQPINTPIKSESSIDSTANLTTGTTVTSAAKLSCNDNIDCLISAANQCLSADGTISITNIQDPFIKGLLHTGKTKYTISKNGNSCNLTYTTLTQSLTLSAVGRAEMKKQGASDAQIDGQIKIMNDSVQSAIGINTSCNSTTQAVTSYLTDQKNGYTSGDINVSADLESSKSEITTSTGQKITCVTK